MEMTELNDDQEKIQKYLRKKYDKNNFIKWPSHITVEINEEDNEIINKVTLILTKEAVGLAKNNKNMQDNDACFEGWAVALKAAGIEKINLNVNGISSSPDFETGQGHYGRFLYRALRFSEQYDDWFSLAESLACVVTNFKEKYLEDESVILYNNVPDKEAGKNGKKECYIEALMASENGKKAFLNSLKKAKEEEDINPEQVYRQLPVGLFLGKVGEGNQVFTDGASAIDLWTLKGDTLQVIELKADNRMVGIITEIFFYSNYMYDLLIEKTFRSTKPKFNNGDKKNRGYDTLFDNDKIKRIEGFMLADVYHPLITSGVLDVLNATPECISNKNQLIPPDVLGVLNAGRKNDKIQYFKAEYDFDVAIKQK